MLLNRFIINEMTLTSVINLIETTSLKKKENIKNLAKSSFHGLSIMWFQGKRWISRVFWCQTRQTLTDGSGNGRSWTKGDARLVTWKLDIVVQGLIEDWFSIDKLAYYFCERNFFRDCRCVF